MILDTLGSLETSLQKLIMANNLSFTTSNIETLRNLTILYLSFLVMHAVLVRIVKFVLIIIITRSQCTDSCSGGIPQCDLQRSSQNWQSNIPLEGWNSV